MDKKKCEKRSENYRNQIIEIVNKIKDPAMLKSIYSFIMGILNAKEKQEAD